MAGVQPAVSVFDGNLVASGVYKCPVQSGWPHEQTISVLLAIPSQWALQYFDPSEGMQLQAAFAHFLELAMVLLSRSAPGVRAGIPVERYDAGEVEEGGPGGGRMI